MSKKNPTTQKVTTKRTAKKNVKKEKPKMNYATVGTIRSIDLSNRTFKLEPISKYRFEKDNDANSWKIVFAEDCVVDRDPQSLKLMSNDAIFRFDKGLESAMIVLKQAKTHIRIVGQVPEKVTTRNMVKPVDVSINVL